MKSRDQDYLGMTLIYLVIMYSGKELHNSFWLSGTVRPSTLIY